MINKLALEVKGLIASFETIKSKFKDSDLNKVTVVYNWTVDDGDTNLYIESLTFHYSTQRVDWEEEILRNDDDDDEEAFNEIIEEWENHLHDFLVGNWEEQIEITSDILNHSFLHILA